jgi:hypothetical protein
MRGYADALKGCVFHGIGLDSASFNVVGAVFPFYKTGRPELHQMIVTLDGTTGDLSKIIRLGTDLLT